MINKIDDRDKAISDARWILMNKYFVLDTETTGLNNAEMCQIAIVYSDGNKYKSLVKPTVPIEEGASKIHHITDETVKDAPSAVDILRHIPVMSMFVAYNTPFDLKVIQQSLKAHGHIYNAENNYFYDVMLIYSAFKGDWDEKHGNYKWHKLGDACEQCGILTQKEFSEEDQSLHDAMYDATLTQKLLKYISIQKLSTEE